MDVITSKATEDLRQDGPPAEYIVGQDPGWRGHGHPVSTPIEVDLSHPVEVCVINLNLGVGI
jgi:hypothetical protein